MSIFNLFRIKKVLAAPWSKHYKEEELNLKIPNISMYDQVKISSYKVPQNRAILYEGRSINYKEFISYVDHLAICFNKLGIKKGEIVTLCLPNVPEVLIALYALNKQGAIANMLHPLSAPNEIKESLNSTKTKYLVTMDLFYSKINSLISKTSVEKVILCNPAYYLPRFKKIIYHILNIGRKPSIINRDLYISWSKFMDTYYDPKIDLTKRFGKNTPAVILHSGGSSGVPKNVVLQNRAFILGSKQEKICLKKLTPGDSCLAIMPNFHGFGLSVCMHTPLTLGCSTILIPKFNAKKFDILFKNTKPTCVLGVPTLFTALIKNNNVKNLDLSNLKYVVSGGDVLNPNLEMEINTYLAKHGSKVKITQGYGLSEALAAVTLGYDEVNKSGSVGVPLPSNHIKIIDPSTRKTLKPGKIGEIVIHSKALMLGYLNAETETNTALQVHDDGHVWLHTGDLGYMDKDGFLFYQGRQKRMIITSGYNVYPAHIEEVIESHPSVLQCSVVGIPHPYKKEVAKAFIVLKESKKSMNITSELKEHCKKYLAPYMIPSSFVYRKQLPKTKLGKVDFLKLQSDIGSDDE